MNTLIVGPVGSGKTSLVRLAKRAVAGQAELFYVDCAIYDTQYAILREILPKSPLVVYKSVYELVKEVQHLLKKKRFFVCFDNFVRLKETEIIRKLIALGVNVVLVGTVEREAFQINENVLSNTPFKSHRNSITYCPPNSVPRRFL